MTKNGNLTPRQRSAITALLTERNIRAAARKAGVGERTLHRWLDSDAAFQTALWEAETEAISAAVRQLAEFAGEAVEALKVIVRDKKTPAAVKVQAANIVLNRLLPMREAIDVEKRLAALEKQLNTGGES